MDTTDQETSRHKFMKSELISHQLQLANKKTRSNSIHGDIDHDEKSATDEPNSGEPEKFDFKQLRNKFENLEKAESPPPRTSIRKSSLQPTSLTAFQSSLNNTLALKPPATAPKPSQFLKSRSSSPLSDETNNITKSNIPRISLNNKLRLSIQELESPTSPFPKSDESSVVSENDIDDRPRSVQSIRAMFKDQQVFPLPQQVQTNSTSQITDKLSPPITLQIPRPPPPRVPPSPEKYIKSQLSGLHSFPSLETADSVGGDSSLSSNPNLSPCNSSDVSFTDEEEDYGAERRVKLRKCLEEVHATEKTYVNILYVLSVKLTVEIKNTCDKDENLILTFNNTYKPLLGNIQQIYQLHHNMILPEFDQYITGHSTGNMWSVLEKHFKVIEVLYKNYYVTYYDTQGKLDDLCKNHPLINEAMLKCQVHLGNLYPITQLNCPNQRLLRYILCMKTYIKYLDEQSTEYKYACSVHDELDHIAVRCEEELVISAAQLNELKERLDNKFECIKENRKLLWHGPLKKQSPRRHADIAQRYMILFSDCILVCGEESGKKLEIKRELSMRGITVDVVHGGRTSLIQNNDQLNTGLHYYPFRVNAVEKSYEFLADKESDREIWAKKIRQASEAYNKRNTAIEIRQLGNHRDEQQLGIRAPAWINDVDVTRCQNCNNRFRTTIISSRRHHCRSCGRCICGSCSTKKIFLEYCKNEGEVRVCDTCYTHFTGTVLSKNTSIWPKPTREVDQTILFGDFHTMNSGVNIWIALQEDYQLRIYGGKLDQAEEYSIKLPDLLDIQLDSDTRTFTLRETTKTHTFNIESNHQIFYEKNDILDEKMKNSDTRLMFYTNIWFEAIQLARSTTLPEWYIRKRDSSDSGVSNIA